MLPTPYITHSMYPTMHYKIKCTADTHQPSNISHRASFNKHIRQDRVPQSLK